MTDERPTDDASREQSSAAPGPSADTASAAPPRKPRKRHWGVILFGIFVVLPMLLFALWTTIALNWSYSKGDRAGYVQKFSRKGWLCKTWEGELTVMPLPGTIPEKFAFSVRDDSVAHQITRLMGSRVSITYEQHRGVPLRCFGDTEYFVTGIRPVS